MKNPQTRIAQDVWAIAQSEQARLGLRNPKEAIESMVRRYAREQTQPQHPTEASNAEN